MKVCDLISKIPDSYMEISINFYDHITHKRERYIIERHFVDYNNIPNNVWESEIDMIVPFYDKISIEVNAK